MRWFPIIPGIVLICFLITGCIPRHYVITPGATGSIVDAETDKPLNNAIVKNIRTDHNGIFSFPARKGWGLTFPFVGGHYLIETPFTISAPGYETRSCRCTVVSPTPSCGEVRIPLQKLSPKNEQNKTTRGQIVMINLDDEEPAEGGVTCNPLLGETTIVELEDAARNGSNSALYKLGIYYLHGINIEKNVDLGRYYMKLAAEAGNKDAYNFFFSAARQDDSEAEVLIGDFLSLGLGVEQNIRDALIWYEIAANNGNAIGMLRLAEIYEAGEVVPVNREKSLYWYHKATETGSAEAMFELAETYRYGLAGPQDLKKAIHWYVEAANAGSIRAEDFLHATIEAQEISPKEKQEAIDWLNKTKKQGT